MSNVGDYSQVYIVKYHMRINYLHVLIFTLDIINIVH